MIVYVKSIRCSEHFPAEIGDSWSVTEGNKLAEKWRVIFREKHRFAVEIHEMIPVAS